MFSRTYTLGDLYIERLRRLMRIRLHRDDELIDVGKRMVDLCIQATALEARDAGRGDEADALLAAHAEAMRARGVGL